MSKQKAHLVITLRLDDTILPPQLVLLSAGIYGADNNNLTMNFKYVGATIYSAEAETYGEACDKVMEFARNIGQHKHLPAWGRLLEFLKNPQRALTE